MPDQVDHFPHLHVRPARGWVNDPNGIGHWDGHWHVMYQWNPNAPQHRDVHWGHMSSPDLLSWRDEGVALRPRPGRIDAAGVWSGVAVHEDDGVALVYTAVPDHARNACVAVARRGPDRTWAQPDVTATEHPDHRQWAEVRDPFLFSVAGHRFGIMGAGRAGGGSQPARGGVVLIYDADDLDRWRLLGPLLCGDEVPADMIDAGSIWECPQLVPIGDRWLLVVSWDVGAGTPAAGPDGSPLPRQGVTGYVGDLDLSGAVPRFVPSYATPLDHGPDFYAPQLVVDGDRVLAWGWSWEGRGIDTNHRSDDDIVASGWAGTLTFPREVVIDASGSAVCTPARELTGLVGEALTTIATESGWELLTAAPAWTLTSDGDVQLDLVDGSGRVRPVWHSTEVAPTRLFVDGSIVEAFGAHGSTTVRAYPARGERWRVRSATRATAAVLRVE